MEKEPVIVVGGGLVGALLTAMLADKGFHVKVFERRPDIRKAEIAAGKSINLALSDRGWRALDLIGASDEIRKIAIPMYGRMVHHIDGQNNFQPYGKEGQAIYSVSRGGLNAKLLELADKNPRVEIFFDHRCVDVDPKTGEAVFENTRTGEAIHQKGAVIFGTDGAFSAVRSKMQHTDRFDYEQKFLAHGYRELLLPAGENGAFLLDKNALHIWPREDFMLIALANEDGSFTSTLFMPFEGPVSFEKLNSDQEIKDFFEKTFPDFTALMPDVVANYKSHPLSSLVTIKCFPWSIGKTALAGDAAHAVVPFYGQGMNAGFEDCTILFELMEKHQFNWEEIFPEYQALRKPDGDAIAHLALRNYIEMRDLVADPDFVLRKKIEAKIYRQHPDKWMPLYSQVTFSHIRYSEALKNGQKQDRIMEKIMQIPDIENTWDSPEIEREILSMLS